MELGGSAMTWMERVTVAESPVDPELLTPLADDTDITVRAEVAGNDNTSPETLTRLATDLEPEVRGRVAGNPRTPPDVLAHLAEDAQARVRGGVGWNPNCPPGLLNSLASDPDDKVRTAVAAHPATPVATLAALSTDPSWRVRGELASNANSDTDLRELAEDPLVREGAAWNPNCPPTLLADLAADADPDVRYATACNPNTPTDDLRELAADPDEEVREGAAHNPNIPVRTLLSLSEDPSGAVRREAATNPRMPPDVLARLAQDEQAQPGVATNPNTPADILTYLAEAGNNWARNRLLDNPATPPGALAVLAYDTELLTCTGGAAAHPTATPQLLTELADSNNHWTRRAVAQHPNTHHKYSNSSPPTETPQYNGPPPPTAKHALNPPPGRASQHPRRPQLGYIREYLRPIWSSPRWPDIPTVSAFGLRQWDCALGRSPPSGDAPHIGLGHDLHERPLRPCPSIQEPLGEVRTPPQFRDTQLDRTHPGVPPAPPVPVTTTHPLRTLLPPRRPADHIRLSRHKPLSQATHHLPQQIIAFYLKLVAQSTPTRPSLCRPPRTSSRSSYQYP